MRSVQPSPCLRRGFTLVELVVVLTILVVVAGLVTVSVGGVMASSREDVTKIAFANIRAAIFGERGRGYYADVRAMPMRIADLYRRRTHFDEVPPFDPATSVGWRGPYLSGQHGRYRLDDDEAGNEIDYDALGFTIEYGSDGDPVPRDGWGFPIVLQIPDTDGRGPSLEELRHARLVSAGKDGVIDTPRTAAEAVAPGTAYFPWVPQCGDDLVFYLRVVDQRPRPLE